MKISFIIPAYNEEKFLGACLESVINLTAQRDDEIIVVNNASTDHTRAVAEKYPQVKVVDEPQKGLVFARAAGAKAASGEILAHIDADCVLPKNWVLKILNEFEKDKNLVGLSGPYFYYDFSPVQNFILKLYYNFYYIFYWLSGFVLKNRSMIQGGNFVVSKKAWEVIGSASSEFNFYGEDTDLARRLSKIGKVKFDLKFNNYTSGRRLKKEGVLKTGIRYALNYFSVIFFKKPFTKKYSDIRQ